MFSNIFEVNDDLKIIWVSMGWTTFQGSEVLIVIDHSGVYYYYITLIWSNLSTFVKTYVFSQKKILKVSHLSKFGLTL